MSQFRDYNSTGLTRRSVLSVGCGIVAVSGCLSNRNDRTNTERSEGSTLTTTPDTPSPTTDVSSPTEEEEEQSSTSDPTPSPTATPPVNQTQYSVGYPWMPFEEGYLQSSTRLLGNPPDLLLVDTQEDWQELIADTDRLSGYPFVTNTAFDSESVVIVESVYTLRTYPTVTEITGVSSGDIVITLRESGTAVQNADVYISLFIRIPKNRSSVSRITVAFLDSEITFSKK